MAFHRLHCTPFLVELLHAVLLNYCTPLSYWLKDQSSNSLLLADYYQNDMEVSNLFWLYAGTKVVTRMAVDGGVASGGRGGLHHQWGGGPGPGPKHSYDFCSWVLDLWIRLNNKIETTIWTSTAIKRT